MSCDKCEGKKTIKEVPYWHYESMAMYSPSVDPDSCAPTEDVECPSCSDD